MTIQAPGELEDVIGEVAASYGAGRLIDSLSSAQLPNKRQVIDALNHLKAVMYLGYYATGELHERSSTTPSCPHPMPRTRHTRSWWSRSAGGQLRGFRSISGRATPTGRRLPPSSSPAQIPRIRSMLSKDARRLSWRPRRQRRRGGDLQLPVHRGDHDPSHGARAVHVQGVPMIPRIVTEHATRAPGSTFTPGRRSGSRSSSTTGPGW
jgi:hypothetical protein